MKKNNFNIILIPIIILILSTASLMYMKLKDSKTVEKSYNEFYDDFSNKKILKVEMSNNDNMMVYLKNGQAYKTLNPSSPNLKEELLKEDVQVKTTTSAPLSKTIPSSLIVISIVYIIFTQINKSRNGGSITSINYERADEKLKEHFNFNKVAGNDEAKESLNEIVDFLKFPEKYKSYGARMPKGVILYGSPGTGKTLLAKAVAGEANVPFYALSGSDFVQMYVGVGAARIRNLFKKAKSHKKAVIFIDEIDAIGKKRDGGKNSSGSDERDQTLNALLTEMSGFGESEGIVVIAATNRLDILDSALLRPGRFDRHIEVSLPDVKAREQILNLYLENKPYVDIDIKNLAIKTSSFSGAKLESLVNEAAILAAKDDSKKISEEHFERAYSIVLAGYDKKNRDHIRIEDRKITAYHEAGHALLNHMLLPEDLISKVTIIPTTKGAGGYTLTIPEDKSYHTLSYLKRKVMVFLGGRASEELVFGKENITTGAYGDLNEVTNIVVSMISEYGMGENLGLLKLSNLGPLGTSYGNIIIEESKKLVDELYEECKLILSSEREKLNKLAEELLVKESLNHNEIKLLIK